MLKNFPLRKNRHWFISWVSSIQFSSLHFPLGSILILSSHLFLGFPSVNFLSLLDEKFSCNVSFLPVWHVPQFHPSYTYQKNRITKRWLGSWSAQIQKSQVRTQLEDCLYEYVCDLLCRYWPWDGPIPHPRRPTKFRKDCFKINYKSEQAWGPNA